MPGLERYIVCMIYTPPLSLDIRNLCALKLSAKVPDIRGQSESTSVSGSDLHHADPVQPLTMAGEDLLQQWMVSVMVCPEG